MIATMIAFMATATVGTSVYSARQEEKRQSSLLQYQEEQVTKAETKVAEAEAEATKQAAETIKQRKQSVTQTVFTSPLGVIGEEGGVGRKSLLGGF